MANTVQLTVKLNADGTGLVADVNQVSRAFRQLDERVDRTDRGAANLSRSFSSLTPVIRSVGAALGGLSLGAGIFQGVRTLASFSQEMSTLQAVTGATEQQFSRLRAEAERLGATTRFSATQAAEGATFLARAGFNAEEVLSSLEGTLQLAQAGALELGSAADIASNVLQGFRLETEETARVVDVLALGANRTNTNVEQLGQAMSFAAPAAAAVGVSIEEASAAVGALSDAGIQAERAGTGLRQILIELEAAGGDLSVQTNGLSNVLETLANRNISLSEATELVGVRQASSLLVLIDSAQKVRELTEEYEAAEGTARRVAETMDDNLNGALLAVASASEAVTLALGNLGGESVLTSSFQGFAEVLRTTAENMDLVVDGATLAAIAIGARMVPAIQASIGAKRAAIAESIRYQAALASMAGVSGRAATAQIALGSAMGGVRAVMAALGGPVGVAITAAAAIALFASNSATAGDNADALAAKVDQLSRSFEKLSERGKESAEAVLEATRAQAEAEIQAVQARLERGGTVTGGRGNSFLPGGVLVRDSDEEIVELERRLSSLRDTSSRARDELLNLRGISEITIEGFERVEGSINGADSAMRTATASATELSIAKKRASGAFRDLESSVRATDRELEEYNRSASDLMDALFPLQKAQREYSAELELLNQKLARGEITATEHAEALRRLKERHSELFPEVERSKAQADELSRAWEEASNRIDEAFADAWKGAFDSFDDFADRLKGAFRDLLGELAHFAITRPILVNLGLAGPGAGAAAGGLFGGLLGAGGAGSGGSGGGGLGSILGGASSAIGAAGFLTGSTNLGQQLGNFVFENINQELGSSIFRSSTNGLGANLFNNLGGNILGGLAGGFGGNALGEALFGKQAESSLGTTIGGIGGALFGGPVGSFVGSLIGGLADVAFGGDGKKRFNTGIFQGSRVGTLDPDRSGSVVTGASGLRLQTFVRRAGPEGQQVADQFLQTVLGLDEALTALTRSAGVDVNFANTTLAGGVADAGRSGVGGFFGLRGFNGVEGSLEEQADAFVVAWLNEVNDQLPQRVRQLLDGVEATAEEMVAAFEAGLAIDQLLDLDVVRRTEEALQELGSANVSLLERYDDLTQAAIDAAAELDGSAGSLSVLAGALRDQKTAAVELAAAYRAVGIESDRILGDTIQSLRESLLSEEELYNLRRQQIADLVGQAASTTDPEELARIRDQVVGFTRDAVGLLEDDQREALVPGIISFLEGFAGTIQDRVDTGLGSLSSREGALQGAVDLELAGRNQLDAASSNLQASQNQLQASETMASAAARLEEIMRNTRFSTFAFGSEIGQIR